MHAERKFREHFENAASNFTINEANSLVTSMYQDVMCNLTPQERESRTISVTKSPGENEFKTENHPNTH